MIRYILIIIVFCCFAGCGGGIISQEETEKFLPGIKEGNKIVVALEAYFNKNKKYPDKLENLAPHFIAEIPKNPISNEDFFYLNYLTGIKPDESSNKNLPAFVLSFRLYKSNFLRDIGAKTWTSFKYRSHGRFGSEKETIHFKYGDWVYTTQFRHEVGESGRVN